MQKVRVFLAQTDIFVDSVTVFLYLQFMAFIYKIIPFVLDMHTLKN